MSLFRPEYALTVALAVAVALFFPVTKDLRNHERRRYYVLQGITLVGAVVGAKLSVLLGDYGWPFLPMKDWGAVLFSGRSITGALILGFVAAETAKPLLGYELPPNDRFATVLPFSFAIGRVGCWAAGCCRGLPWDGWCAISYADGISRHPAQLYELAFQLSVGLLFVFLLRRGLLFGRFFALYLVIYGAFRFCSEMVRETPKLWPPFSGYQAICVLMVLVGGAFLVKRTWWPPAWARLAPLGPLEA